MIQKKHYLSGRQALELRGPGHHLKPTAMVGREGITPAVLVALEAVLAAHELVKIKIQEGCPLEREDAAEKLAAGTGGKIVQIIGNMILLYRQKPPEKEEAAPKGRRVNRAGRDHKKTAGSPRRSGSGRRPADKTTPPRGRKPANKGPARRRQKGATGR